MVQKIYSKMHPVSCTNIHHDVIDLVNQRMVKNTQIWISWKRNITSIETKKFLTCALDDTFWEFIDFSGCNLINMIECWWVFPFVRVKKCSFLANSTSRAPLNGQILFKTYRGVLLGHCKIIWKKILTHFMPVVFFYSYPLKISENLGFLIFSGSVIQRDQWHLNLCLLVLMGLRKERVTRREKCANTELLLVRIFLYSDWIWRFTQC